MYEYNIILTKITRQNTIKKRLKGYRLAAGFVDKLQH
jgi:hypothetical protein